MDPFNDTDPVMGDNPTTVETYLDAVCQLDQEQLDSFRIQRDKNEDHEDEETWEPEELHRNFFDTFIWERLSKTFHESVCS